MASPPAPPCVAFSAEQDGAAARTGLERSGVSGRISARVLRSVLSVRGEVEQAGRLSSGAFLEKPTSKCCPLKLLCGEPRGIAAALGLGSLRRLSSQEKSRDLSRTRPDCYTFIK